MKVLLIVIKMETLPCELYHRLNIIQIMSKRFFSVVHKGVERLHRYLLPLLQGMLKTKQHLDDIIVGFVM